MANVDNSPDHWDTQKKIFGHPVGLFILFFTEMWERFSYYGMRAILVLFLTSSTKGGLGWTDEEALSLYGVYTMLVYVMSIPGGIIADRFLGQKRSVMLGGFLLVAGHLLMAYTELWAFYGALGLIVLGVGFLKPNISTMVGGLYRPGDGARDSGFIIFYMGINLGAFLSSLIVGYVGEKIGWHYGFALAGIGMIIGQLVFVGGQKYLKFVGNLTSKTDSQEVIDRPFTKKENDRIKVLLTSFLIVLVFWAAFEQAGGFMNLFTKQYTDRFATTTIQVDEYSASDQATIDSVRVAVENKSEIEINSFSDLIKGFSSDPKSVDELKEQFSQKGYGDQVQVRTYDIQKSDTDSALYSNLTSEAPVTYQKDGKYIVSDLNNNQSGFIVPTSWFQSLNAMFILMFGGVFAALWIYLGKRGKEPNTMFKFGLSTIILGIGFLLMVFATIEKDANFFGKSSMWWLVGAYLFHTLGELCISPIALSFITKVAPKKIVASMMGVYFAVTGLGNWAAAKIGEQAAAFGPKAVFAGITIFAIAFGIILIFFSKKLIALTHGAEEGKSAEDDE